MDPTDHEQLQSLFLLSLPLWPVAFTQQMPYRARGALLRPVVIAGCNEEGRLVREPLEQNPTLGYRFEGCVEDLLSVHPDSDPNGSLSDPSLITDTAILLRTVPVVLTSRCEH